jgi:6-phosphogluconolactonase (cycloisomerase 2 family)
MKFSKPSQLFLVSTIGLVVATFLAACQIVTIDYVFVADSTGTSATSEGQIQIFAVDSQSGALRQGATTVDSGGIAPVALTVTSDYANLYVANQTSKNVVHYTIGSSGALTKADVITLSDAPVALAVNAANSYLYVLTGSTTGATTPYLREYALSSGTIGAETSTPLAFGTSTSSSYPASGDLLVPTALNVLEDGTAVYASLYDLSAYNPGGTATSSAHSGWLFGFTIGSSGVLTATTSSPYQAGIKPTGIASDATVRFVYVTDFASNELVGYAIQTTDQLTFLTDGPYKTGNEPSGIVIDPRAKYIYVSNTLDATVSAYSITTATGTPSTISSSYSTDTQPMAIAVDPALGRFVYTGNYLGNTISGFRLTADTGALTATQATPYSTGAKPTALVIVPHGNHASQSVSK